MRIGESSQRYCRRVEDVPPFWRRWGSRTSEPGGVLIYGLALMRVISDVLASTVHLHNPSAPTPARARKPEPTPAIPRAQGGPYRTVTA